jgi:hypothetical protein
MSGDAARRSARATMKKTKVDADEKLVDNRTRVKQARVRLRDLSRQSKGSLGKKTWSREDLHER